MELPFHLKTLEPLPGALDILRFLGQVEDYTANVDTIVTTLDLSDRRFSKAIRRLVTKEYVVMDGDMVYRLTEQGESAVEELRAYDEESGEGLDLPEASPTSPVPETPLEPATINVQPQHVSRRMVLALPQTLTAEEPADVFVGFHHAGQMALMPGSAQLAVRLSVLNGQPEAPHDMLFTLTNSETRQAMAITPGGFKEVRVRLEVFQLNDDATEIEPAGGMVVDVPVVPEGTEQSFVAYGTDIKVEMR